MSAEVCTGARNKDRFLKLLRVRMIVLFFKKGTFLQCAQFFCCLLLVFSPLSIPFPRCTWRSGIPDDAQRGLECKSIGCGPTGSDMGSSGASSSSGSLADDCRIRLFFVFDLCDNGIHMEMITGSKEACAL